MITGQTIAQPHVNSDVLSLVEMCVSVNNWLAANRRRCVIKKHRARYLHYDFRLEFEGVLLSWVIRDGPSYREGERRAAVQVEDHDPRYMTSERVIPPGEYGAGPVMLWDEGFYIALPGYEDISKCLRNGCLRFRLECHKLRGNWTLRRRAEAYQEGGRQNWELIKEPDQYSRGEGAPDILTEAPNSVSTGRTLDEIEQDENTRTATRSQPDQLRFILTV